MSLLLSLVVYGIPIAIAVWFVKSMNAIVRSQREMVEQLRIMAQQGRDVPEKRLP